MSNRPASMSLDYGAAGTRFLGGPGACRLVPEWISICSNEFTRPNWSGNDAMALEKDGIGAEKPDRAWRSA